MVSQALRCKWKLIGRVTSAAAEEPVTRGNCLSAMTFATTTTQVCRVFMAVRVTRVRIWQIGSSATNPLGITGGTDTPSIAWESDSGPLIKHLRPQVGVEVGYTESRPPRNSFAGFWSLTNINETDVLFTYNCAAGALIQVDMDCVVNDSSVAAVLGVSSGRTVGENYYALGAKIVFLDMNN